MPCNQLILSGLGIQDDIDELSKVRSSLRPSPPNPSVPPFDPPADMTLGFGREDIAAW